MQPIIEIPEAIIESISDLLFTQETKSWMQRAESLHERYLNQQKGEYLLDTTDALAYLALRTPATYAQILGALLQVQELLPDWKPATVLDIGAGPGTGVWAVREVFPTMTTATGIDKNHDLLTIGKQIAEKAGVSEIQSLLVKDVRYGLGLEEDEKFDITIISSVLNELPTEKGEQLVRRAMSHTRGVLLIVEPGTEVGNKTVSHVAKIWSDEARLLAPYIDSSFVDSTAYWIHFNQRFQRPVFQRTLRQRMRESSDMASDFEDAKYSYVALSNIPSEMKPWGRSIGPVKLQKGFLEVPILTKEKIEIKKVLKRNKEQYTFAKNLHWGETIEQNKAF